MANSNDERRTLAEIAGITLYEVAGMIADLRNEIDSLRDDLAHTESELATARAEGR